jgi:hypothetical protein
MSPRAAGIGFVAYFFGLLNREGRVDSFGCDSEIYGELDVFWTEQADECLNPVRRRLSQPCSGPVTIGDRGYAMGMEPVGVAWFCDAKCPYLAEHQQLHDHLPQPLKL